MTNSSTTKKMCSSGSGGAIEAEMANWSELLHIWHLAAKVLD
jgi:hypothetical protein